jgi:hypothetical protein
MVRGSVGWMDGSTLGEGGNCVAVGFGTGVAIRVTVDEGADAVAMDAKAGSSTGEATAIGW